MAVCKSRTLIKPWHLNLEQTSYYLRIKRPLNGGDLQNPNLFLFFQYKIVH